MRRPRARSALASTPIPTIPRSPAAARWRAGPTAGAEVHVVDHDAGRQGHPTPPPIPRRWRAARDRERRRRRIALGLAGHHHLRSSRRRARRRPVAASAAIVRVDPRASRPTSCAVPTRPRCSSATATCSHVDHRVTGWATLDAVAPRRRLRTTSPSSAPTGSTCTACATLLPVGHARPPNAWVDIERRARRKIDGAVLPRSQLRPTPATGSASSSASAPPRRAGARRVA